MKKNETLLNHYLNHPKVYIKAILLIFLIGIVFYPVNAGPDNIAPLAKVTASSSLSDEYGPQKVTDGLINISNKGEWISKSGMTPSGSINYPWIQLDWDLPVNINKVVIYGRPNEHSYIGVGRLRFSD